MQAVDAMGFSPGRICRRGRNCRVKLRSTSKEISDFAGFPFAARHLLLNLRWDWGRAVRGMWE
jgi:hypothetical protein